MTSRGILVAATAAIASWCLVFPLTCVAQGGPKDDAVTALIRAQTDAFARASDAQDQTELERLLHPDVLFSGGSGEVDHDPGRDQIDDIAAQLKSRTQVLREASSRGDLAALRAEMDDAAVVIDEEGAVHGPQDLRTLAPAVEAGCRAGALTISDWVLHHVQGVAVSSFTTDQAVDCGSQTIHYSFLSVEAWVSRATRWTLLASQTIPLHQDPPAIALTADNLAEYVGRYTDGAGLVVKVVRAGQGLASSIGADPPSALVAEGRDLFYRPGSPPGYARRRVAFHRDAQGHVTQYISRNLVLAKVGTAEAPVPPAAPGRSVKPSLTLRDFVLHQAGDVAVATFLHDRVSDYHGHTLNATYRSTETWVRVDGAWRMISSQGRELDVAPVALELSAERQEEYTGTYGADPTLHLTISRAGGGLVAQAADGKAQALMALAQDVFTLAAAPRTLLLFQRDATGRISGALWRRDERDIRYARG